MNGPGVIRLKRKRDQQPPDTLILEPQRKRQQGDDGTAKARYIRQEQNGYDPESPQQKRRSDAFLSPRSDAAPAVSNGRASPTEERPRRIFKLRRSRRRESDAALKQQREGEDEENEAIATVMETKAPSISASTKGSSGKNDGTPSTPLKRPGRGAAINRTQAAPPDPSVDHVQIAMQLQSVADSLSAFADEEATKDHDQRRQQQREQPAAPQPLTPLKPKLLATPRLSGVRSRELHHQRVSAAAAGPATDTDVDMTGPGPAGDDEDADEYVYDTYVLAAGTDDATLDDTFSPDAAAHLRSVGYIIITDADQAIWETYQDDEAEGGAEGEGGGGANGRADDEDDENAEDWHGADYPDEEEDDEEDEEDRAYGYLHGRNGGPDDEEWDADTGSWSDEEDERQRNPWRTIDPKEFVRRMREEAEG